MSTSTKISDQDLAFFQYLYDFKTLTLQQSWELAYPDSHLSDVTPHLLELCKEKYINYKPDKLYTYRFTMAMKGIYTLFDMTGRARFDIDEWGNKTRAYKQESELAIRDNILSHQTSLNQFLVEFIVGWRKHDTQGLEYEIQAETGFRDLEYFRPDAIIKARKKGDEKWTFLFIEQDMGFESRRQLLEKWDRYRRFVETHRVDDEIERAVMLFIIAYDTTKDAPHNMSFQDMDALYKFRTNEVCRSIIGLLPSMLDGYFDCFINTKERLQECIFERLIGEIRGDNKFEEDVIISTFKEELGYKVGRAWNLKKRFYDTRFSYFVRMEDENGRIVKDGEGKNLSFFMDDASYTPMSLIAKATHMERANAFSQSFDNRIPYSRYLIYTGEKEYVEELMRYCKCDNAKDVLILG